MTDAREMVVGRIQAGGPLTFAEFVEIALYHPEAGYYTAGPPRIGRSGDFLTAPETHPLFGLLLGRQIVHLAESIDPAARPFQIVELGAGTGSLAEGVLDHCRAAAPDLYQRLRYTIVEISPISRAAQATRLVRHADRLEWWPLADVEAGSVRGVILANEFFDALPFHRLVRQAGGLREIYVDLAGDELIDRVGPLSTPALVEYFDRLGRWPPEGGQVEVSLASLTALDRLAAVLDRGVLIAIDYGYQVEQWLGQVRPRGTFLAHYRHTTNDEPYRRIGRQDLTAQVDFTTLAQAGQRLGFDPLGPIAQRDYLLALGRPAYANALGASPARAIPPAERRRNREAIASLVDPAGMGKFKVLLLARDLPGLTLDQVLDLPGPALDPADLPRLPPAAPPPDPFADLWQEAFGPRP